MFHYFYFVGNSLMSMVLPFLLWRATKCSVGYWLIQSFLRNLTIHQPVFIELNRQRFSLLWLSGGKQLQASFLQMGVSWWWPQRHTQPHQITPPCQLTFGLCHGLQHFLRSLHCYLNQNLWENCLTYCSTILMSVHVFMGLAISLSKSALFILLLLILKYI